MVWWGSGQDTCFETRKLSRHTDFHETVHTAQEKKIGMLSVKKTTTEGSGDKTVR